MIGYGYGYGVNLGALLNQIPAKELATLWLDGTIIESEGNYYFVDKIAGNNVLINDYDFPDDWVKGFPYKSAATIDVFGQTGVPVVSLFQNFDYTDTYFCRHVAQVVDANGVELKEPYVTDIVAYSEALTGDDLTEANTYYSVPVNNELAKWVSGDYATNTAAITALANGAIIYNRTGDYTEVNADNRLTINKQVAIEGKGKVNTLPNTGASSCIGMAGNCTLKGIISINQLNLQLGFRLTNSANIIDKVFMYLQRVANTVMFVKEAASGTVISNSVFKAGAIGNMTQSQTGTVTFDTCYIEGIFYSGMIASAVASGYKMIIKNSKIKTSLSSSGGAILAQSAIKEVDFIGNKVYVNSNSLLFKFSNSTEQCIYNIFDCIFNITTGNTGTLINATAEGALYDVRRCIWNVTDGNGRFILLTNSRGLNLESSIAVQKAPLILLTNLSETITIKSNRLVSTTSVDNDNATNVWIVSNDPATIQITIEKNLIFNARHFGSTYGHHASIYINNYVNAKIAYNFTSGAGIGNIIIKSPTMIDSDDCIIKYNISLLNSIFVKGQSHVKIFNNTVINSRNRGILLSPADDLTLIQTCIVRNNIVVDTSDNLLVEITSEDATARHDIDYNIYYSPLEKPFSHNGIAKTWAEWQALGYDAHSVMLTTLEQAKALFRDYDNGDYSLTVGSAAIGAGVALDAAYDDGLDASTEWGSDTETPVIVTKQQGAAWDCGAYVH